MTTDTTGTKLSRLDVLQSALPLFYCRNHDLTERRFSWVCGLFNVYGDVLDWLCHDCFEERLAQDVELLEFLITEGFTL